MISRAGFDTGASLAGDFSGVVALPEVDNKLDSLASQGELEPTLLEREFWLAAGEGMRQLIRILDER